MYYDALRRKVEDKGTENFPEQGRQKLYGELIMIVTVNHDGRVLSHRGGARLGQPARWTAGPAIARAAPFGGFTPEANAQRPTRSPWWRASSSPATRPWKPACETPAGAGACPPRAGRFAAAHPQHAALVVP